MKTRSTWFRWPTSNPRVDLENPLNRGLVYCVPPSYCTDETAGVYAPDLVAPFASWWIAFNGAPGSVVTPYGWATNWSSTTGLYGIVPPTGLSSPGANGFTCCIAVTPTSSTPGAVRAFFGLGNSGSATPFIQLYQGQTDGHVRGQIRNNASTSHIIGAGATTQQLIAGRTYIIVWRWTGSAWTIFMQGGARYDLSGLTLGAFTEPDRAGVSNLWRTSATSHGQSPVIGPWVWGRPLSDAECWQLIENPFQTFIGPPRHYFFVESSGADLTVDIDTAGSVTIEGQEVAVSLGVALNAGAITIQGQSATVALGVDLDAGAVNIEGQATAVTLGINLDEAGSILIEGQDATIQVGANLAVTIDTPGEITVQGQTATIALGVDLANAGQINIEGQSATLALGLNVDDAGSILIGGEDVSAVVTGDLDIPIEVAGSIVIEGQDCAIALTVTPPMEGGSRGRRRPSRIKPEQLPAFKVDIDFMQPWQECRATVEVSDEFDFEFFQEGALANMTAEAITEVEIDARQEVAELMATLSAVPMRGVAVKSMPRVETARVSVSVTQAPAELSILVSVE